MDQTVVRDDIRHREDPGVAPLRQHVGAGTGQCPVRRDQRVVYPVHPPHDPAHAGEVESRRGRGGQHAGCRAGGDQLTHRGCGQLDVGVEVQAGEGAAYRVAQPQGVRLARHRGLLYPYAVDLPRRVRGRVGARVGDHDDVELAGRRAVEQPAQIAGDDGLFVVCRYDDADHRIAHAAQDSGCATHRTRESEHAVHE
jgi:hypothetical protein